MNKTCKCSYRLKRKGFGVIIPKQSKRVLERILEALRRMARIMHFTRARVLPSIVTVAKENAFKGLYTFSSYAIRALVVLTGQETRYGN